MNLTAFPLFTTIASSQHPTHITTLFLVKVSCRLICVKGMVTCLANVKHSTFSLEVLCCSLQLIFAAIIIKRSISHLFSELAMQAQSTTLPPSCLISELVRFGPKAEPFFPGTSLYLFCRFNLFLRLLLLKNGLHLVAYIFLLSKSSWNIGFLVMPSLIPFWYCW